MQTLSPPHPHTVVTEKEGRGGSPFNDEVIALAEAVNIEIPMAVCNSLLNKTNQTYNMVR